MHDKYISANHWNSNWWALNCWGLWTSALMSSGVVLGGYPGKQQERAMFTTATRYQVTSGEIKGPVYLPFTRKTSFNAKISLQWNKISFVGEIMDRNGNLDFNKNIEFLLSVECVCSCNDFFKFIYANVQISGINILRKRYDWMHVYMHGLMYVCIWNNNIPNTVVRHGLLH